MYPQYVEIENKKYKINTDFRIAIECNKIAEDESIGDLERGLAVIYKLFGDDGINTPDHYGKLLEMAQKYLLCGKEYNKEINDKPDMDFEQDYSYITASFLSDYGMDLDNMEMHWWKFMDLMNGLSNSEMGNCCILNRIRNLRNFNTKDIKDTKTRHEIEKAKREVALKRKPKQATEKQRKSAEQFFKALGL